MAERRFHMLEFDLTSQRTKTVDVTEDVHKFLGGRGLGAKLLWDRVPRDADPLGTENILYFGVGPLTGLWGSIVNVSAKSPLTLLRGESNMNGHFGAEMVYAGYNAGLLITGKASRPVYLFIKDDRVEIRDAAHLWGKQNMAAQQALRTELRKELDDQNFRVATIGPAGEHMVRNADICHDFYHHAARLGMGAVMGSKNLKAIAVKGTRPPEYAHPDKLYEIMQTYIRDSFQFKASKRRWGSTTSMPQRYYNAAEGIKNKQLGWHEVCDLSNPVKLEQQFKVWSDSCSMCLAGCKVPYMRRDPPLGPCAGEMRHDDAGGWNANVLIPGYDTQVYLTPLVDELGLDGEDVSGVVAWMMECYQRGIVTKEDLGGIDLTWGNLEAICKLLRKIAYREGIGDILAEGLKLAPPKIGKGSEKYAMSHKGVAITSNEVRWNMANAIDLAVVPFGEIHGGRGNADRAVFDSLTTCTFHRATIREVFGGVAQWGTEMLKATYDWDMTTQEWDSLLKRNSMLERCYCMREGYVPTRDDDLPERFFKETIYTKYGEPKVLDRQKFLAERERWYLENGLTKDGIPPKETLARLGLDFTIPAIPALA